MFKRGTLKKGFTLVEAIVVLVVLAIVTAATYGTTKGLVARAEQNARDQVARSLFMAAQSALTQIYANDPAQAKRYAAMTQINLSSIDPWPQNEEWQKELAVNGGDKQNIVTLVSNGGTDAQAQMLMELVEPFVDDKTVLSNNILIEYNRVSGNVLACFYSDETALSHGESGYNVYERSEASLKQNLVGYYGVSYTGTRPVRLPIDELPESDELDVALVDYDDAPEKQGNDINSGKNYGLLTLECALPDDAPPDIVYEIAIHCKNPATGTTIGSFRLKVGDNTGADIQLSHVRGRNLAAALTNPLPYGSGRRAALFMDQTDASGRDIMVLVLDSATATWGIRDLYSEISDGILIATLSVEVTGQMPKNYLTAIAPNSEHSLYAGLDEQSGSTAPTYTVSSVRHLNNLRYGADRHFLQTQDLAVADYNGTALPLSPIADATTRTFSGEYDGDNYKITGLTMPQNTQQAGLFLKNTGRIAHVFLQDAELVGSQLAGGIAAENTGTVYACTVYHRASTAPSGAGYYIEAGANGVAGGIAAKNSGEIMSCYVGTGVSAGEAAGGIAGISSGTVHYSEVCTAMQRTVSSMPGDLVGATYFGATASRSRYNYGDQTFEGLFREIGPNQRWIMVTGTSVTDGTTMRTTGATAGGIVGLQTGGVVKYCVNAAHIGAGTGVAGGLVGSVFDEGNSNDSDHSQLTYCYNAGWVQSSVLTGGLAGQLYGGHIQYCYNTAPVNTTLSLYDAVLRCFLPAEAAQTQPVAGGLVGRVHQYSIVEYCYNASYVCAGELTAYAGAFGRTAMDSSSGPVKIKCCYFLRTSLNTSQRYWLFINNENPEQRPMIRYDDDGLECLTMVDRYTMKHMVDESANRHRRLVNSSLSVRTYNDHVTPEPAGPFFRLNNPPTNEPSKQYLFPVFRVNDDNCNMGLNFHRTPYYPILERYAELTLSRGEGALEHNYILTAYVPDKAVTLRLWMNIKETNKDKYYAYIANIPASGPASTVTFTCAETNPGFSDTIDGTATVTSLTPTDNYYDAGCRKKIEIVIPISTDPTSPFQHSPQDLHGQMLAASTVKNLSGNLVWAETKVP